MASQNLIGSHVRRARRQQSLSQEELTARCNVLGWDISRGTLSKIEAQIRRVNDGELVLLAQALRVPVGILLATTVAEALRVARQGNSVL